MDDTNMKLVGGLVVGVVIGYVLKGIMMPSTSKITPPVEKKQEQTSSAKPSSKEEKIANAKSAAIDSISENATVVDWPTKEGAELITLQKGTNDWTCIPDYPVSPGNDPMCVDKAGMDWMIAYMMQKKPQLSQNGLGYMLQGGSDASNTDPFATEPKKGDDWVNTPGHLMIFPSSDLEPEVYGTNPNSGNPWIMFSGTPYEHLMVPVK